MHPLPIIVLAFGAVLFVGCASTGSVAPPMDAGSGDATRPDTRPPMLDSTVGDTEPPGDAPDLDTSVPDTSVPDTSVPLDSCASAEVCNGLDDDCNGEVDEGFNLMQDPDNCGTCGNVCTLADARPGCRAGLCEIWSCHPGFGDCDSSPGNGCETALDMDSANCGACGNACTTGVGCTAGECDDDLAATITTTTTGTCVVLRSGRVLCWGTNTGGRLGHGGTLPALTPVAIPGETDAIDVALGDGHGCLVRTTGQVLCWGSNGAGQLGDGTRTAHAVPRPVPGITDALEVVAGASYTCIRRSTGAVACWGSNAANQLGDGTTVARSLTPVTVVNLPDAVELAAGPGTNMARRMDGTVVGWGGGIRSGVTPGNTPTPVAGYGTTTVAIALGDYAGCAVQSPGSVLCLGINGSTGGGTLTDATQVAVFARRTSTHYCALRATGQVMCWGRGIEGQLGNGTNTSISIPVLVRGLTDAVSISTGSAFSCAVRATGGVVCWGSNASGGLGIGTGPNTNIPVAVTGLP